MLFVQEPERALLLLQLRPLAADAQRDQHVPRAAERGGGGDVLNLTLLRLPRGAIGRSEPVGRVLACSSSAPLAICFPQAGQLRVERRERIRHRPPPRGLPAAQERPQGSP